MHFEIFTSFSGETQQYRQYIVRGEAHSIEDCHSELQNLLNALIGDFKYFLRSAPAATIEENFDTNLKKIIGTFRVHVHRTEKRITDGNN